MNTCLHTNYQFEHGGQILNDYTELSEIDVSYNDKIYMRPCKYDEKSARHHIKRLIQLLEQPTTLTTSGDAPKKQSRSRSNSNADEQQKPSEVEEKLKQNYESFMQVIRQQQTKTEQLPVPERD